MVMKQTPINVLVTGLGPYPDGNGHRIDPNISYVLTTLLPPRLDPNTSINPSSNPINIITLPFPIKTEYAYIRRFCRELHATSKTTIANQSDINPDEQENEHEPEFEIARNLDIAHVDVVIHLGEARIWRHISIERMAFKQGFSSNWWFPPQYKAYYDIKDDIGQTVYDIGACPWGDVPMGIESAMDIDAIASGANSLLATRASFTGLTAVVQPGKANVSDESTRPIEIRPHREGGFYCCGFTYYESLANCYVNRRKANVLFCHVPGLDDPDSLAWQRDGIVAIVVAAAREVCQRP